MILFNAALVEVFWERLLVLPLEQRQVAGQEPPLEQRLEGQLGYLGESLLHLHPHRAPITATQPTDIRLTDIRATQPMDILLTVIRSSRSRAIGIQASRGLPDYPGPTTYEYQGGLPPSSATSLMELTNLVVGAARNSIITVRLINDETNEKGVYKQIFQFNVGWPFVLAK
jgi:hypothetical protein